MTNDRFGRSGQHNPNMPTNKPPQNGRRPAPVPSDKRSWVGGIRRGGIGLCLGIIGMALLGYPGEGRPRSTISTVSEPPLAKSGPSMWEMLVTQPKECANLGIAR